MSGSLRNIAQGDSSIMRRQSMHQTDQSVCRTAAIVATNNNEGITVKAKNTKSH